MREFSYNSVEPGISDSGENDKMEIKYADTLKILNGFIQFIKKEEPTGYKWVNGLLNCFFNMH